MTKTTLTATALAALIGTAAFAAPVDDLVAQLQAEGYTDIEIEPEGETLLEVEAEKDGMEREILIVAETGEILSDTTEPDDEDDDDDAEDEDDSDDDQDDADKG